MNTEGDMSFFDEILLMMGASDRHQFCALRYWALNLHHA